MTIAIAQNKKLPNNSINISHRILICGIGGAGCNALNNMATQFGSENLIAMNTDEQTLNNSLAATKIKLGESGFGAGSKPAVAKQAALDSEDTISELFDDVDLVILCAGLGGGTGSGALPEIARMAKAKQAIVVSIVTLPFRCELNARNRIAQAALEALKPHIDCFFVIHNQKLADLDTQHSLKLREGFLIMDHVCMNFVASILDIIGKHGLVNLDFADFITTMKDKGQGFMGIGYATGNNAGKLAIDYAINNPLLDISSLYGASNVLVNIVGNDITLHDIENILEKIESNVGEESCVIYGTMECENSNDIIRFDDKLVNMWRNNSRNKSFNKHNPINAQSSMEDNENKWIKVTFIATGLKDINNTISTSKSSGLFG